MTARRAFLKAAGAGLLPGQARAGADTPGSDALRSARALVADRRLGRIWLCRIPGEERIGDVEFVLGSQPRPIFDIDTGVEEIVLLGSEATLAIGGGGLQLFSGRPKSLKKADPGDQK